MPSFSLLWCNQPCHSSPLPFLVQPCNARLPAYKLCSTVYLLFPFLRRVIKAKNSCHSPSFLYCQPRIHFEQAKKQVNSDRVTVKVHSAPCEGGKQAVCCIVSTPTNCEGEAGSLQLLGLDTSLLLLIQALSCVPPALPPPPSTVGT